ncbi:DNA/RNA nuclease SfsA [Loigolactobacillus backii]|uniref:Sugar fermentation stimulation protein homolog n=1 Tax=Loigolactobacillus backii TaxID=375175 RepID=A0A192GZS6_9LACO|nr:DNA/RNA nuclease SfsA [Loigolactobacillus backii]ANK60831.1 sugar fermentation stimulation protein SfsA [Loigolactobacillus backii]ANK61595.1 sugar fermentation stimulation protein SfsA [Loigolactobacillus backii]ANK65784.1 sugar fermentation stimulation protein SfsA [Loigolactobacillus backii]ANK68261.1 sugar fermentation stimulation protein SfsA [Loigolactobacillus backii]ANK69207.1 sugar fermentation stimulation protein SfsA [Loigolactobacillus backii]
MKYANITIGTFLARPNRFIANCEIAGSVQAVHVKNTGRNKEILRPQVQVALVKSNNPKRKTKYDLVAALCGERWINIDSQAPNHIAYESILDGTIQLPGLAEPITTLRPEVVFSDSRFDLFGSTATESFFVEIKGVTLANADFAAFPDAPTIRAEKHVRTLMAARASGYGAYLCFIVQMSGIREMTVYKQRDLKLYQEILAAQKAGVTVLAYGCAVTPGEIKAVYPVKLNLARQFHELTADELAL